jgi:hypothetical protein
VTSKTTNDADYEDATEGPKYEHGEPNIGEYEHEEPDRSE